MASHYKEREIRLGIKLSWLCFNFKILQNEQLDEISPLGNEEVSAVSQAWFTTKEDKDSLTNKGKVYCEI